MPWLRVPVAAVLLALAPWLAAQAPAAQAAPTPAPGASAPMPAALLRPYQVSPAASVSQDLGICTVRIDYHRPAVKGRKLWGALVPFGQVWRAGANEATTISFSDPVKIEGRDLAAGSYALFAIPGKDRWTFIFNREARQWGAFAYQAGQDALRVEVEPGSGPAQEYLAYTIQVAGPDRLRVELAWESLRAGFTVALDVQGSYWAYLTRTLAAHPDAWQALNQGVNYCLLSDSHLDQAMAWVDRSIAIQEGARNLELKARLLRRAGRTGEALPLLGRAIGLAAAAGAKGPLADLEKLRTEWETGP